jgi:hypothetical protein
VLNASANGCACPVGQVAIGTGICGCPTGQVMNSVGNCVVPPACPTYGSILSDDKSTCVSITVRDPQFTALQYSNQVVSNLVANPPGLWNPYIYNVPYYTLIFTFSQAVTISKLTFSQTGDTTHDVAKLILFPNATVYTNTSGYSSGIFNTSQGPVFNTVVGIGAPQVFSLPTPTKMTSVGVALYGRPNLSWQIWPTGFAFA